MQKTLNSETKSLKGYFQSPRRKTDLSLSSCSMKNKSSQQNSFYNDGKQLHLSKSQLLSQRRFTYQAKSITYSERKKYQINKLESIIHKRDIKEKETHQFDQKTNIMEARKRISNLTLHKYHKLVYGSREKIVNKRILDNSINETIKNKSTSVKWISPFREGKPVFDGQPIVSQKVKNIIGNSDSSQLKVLNLDRLFRNKEGKLTNVVPLPMPKLQSLTARANIVKTMKKKDKIHQIIDQFNKLLRIVKFKKTAPQIGVKGKNFILAPTLQELMGIKQKPVRLLYSGEVEEITDQVFIEYCENFKQLIKQDVILRKKFINGIKQNGKFDLVAFTRFYGIFVNRIATFQDKINFLVSFFIAPSKQRVQIDELKEVLEIMCAKLPKIENLNAKTDLLTQNQKSKIFLQALHKVLFGELKQIEGISSFNIEMIRMIFLANVDAVDLLIKLLYSN